MPCGHCGIGGHNRKTCPLLRAGVQEVPPVPTHRPTVAGQSTSTQPSTTLIPPAPTHGLIPVIPPPPSHTLNPFKKTHFAPKKLQCVICLEDIGDKPRTELKCGHIFCTDCIMTNISVGNTNCPMCRTPLMEPNREINDLKQQIVSLEQFNHTYLQQLNILTHKLMTLGIHSSDELTVFIHRYRAMNNIIRDNFLSTGMSLQEFINMNAPPEPPPANLPQEH